MYWRVAEKNKVSYKSHEFHAFFAVRFAFFAAFSTSRSSDVETEAPLEEVSADSDCTGVENFTFLLWSVVWGIDLETDRFPYPA